MGNIDCVKDHYSSKNYYAVIGELSKTPFTDLDEWSFVFLANTYYNLFMFDECLETIDLFNKKYPKSKKLEYIKRELLKKKTVYTIGYSSFPLNRELDLSDFIDQLKKNNISYLIDVRTLPLSKTFPSYNIDNLTKKMMENEISYISLKDEFGARRHEDLVYTELPIDMISKLSWGKKYKNNSKNIKYVDFELVYKLKTFKDGFNRCTFLLNKGNICFMCSETHPWDCHRVIMVSEYFRRNGYFIKHIVGNKCISQKECNLTLKDFFNESKIEYINANKQKNLMMFESKSGNDQWDEFFNDYSLEKAIRLKNIEIGYKR